MQVKLCNFCNNIPSLLNIELLFATYFHQLEASDHSIVLQSPGAHCLVYILLPVSQLLFEILKNYEQEILVHLPLQTYFLLVKKRIDDRDIPK